MFGIRDSCCWKSVSKSLLNASTISSGFGRGFSFGSVVISLKNTSASSPNSLRTRSRGTCPLMKQRLARTIRGEKNRSGLAPSDSRSSCSRGVSSLINSSRACLSAAARSRFVWSKVLNTAGCGKSASAVPLIRPDRTWLTLALCSTSFETITPTSLIGSLPTSVLRISTSSPWDFWRCSIDLSNRNRSALFSCSRAPSCASSCSTRNFNSCQPVWTSSTDAAVFSVCI